MSTVESQLEFLQGTLDVLILRTLQLGPNHADGIAELLKARSDDEFVPDNGA